jgi:hypothetical protein
MGWDNVPSQTEANWDYYVDFTINHAYYVANVPLPEDPNLARMLRVAFNEYMTRRSLLSSLLEFVSRFGANTRRVDEMISGLEEGRKSAEGLYLQGDYEGSWEAMEATLEEFQVVSTESMRLRERALLWVYVVEWLAVTGTLLVCGMVLWTLMIRKRLYRQVAVTRGRL